MSIVVVLRVYLWKMESDRYICYTKRAREREAFDYEVCLSVLFLLFHFKSNVTHTDAKIKCSNVDSLMAPHIFAYENIAFKYKTNTLHTTFEISISPFAYARITTSSLFAFKSAAHRKRHISLVPNHRDDLCAREIFCMRRRVNGANTSLTFTNAWDSKYYSVA